MIFSWFTSSSPGHFPVAMDKYLLFYMEMMTIVNFWRGNLPPTLYFLFLFSPPRNNCESENSYMEIRAEIAYKSHVSSFPQTVVDLWYTLMPHCYGHTILMIWNHTHTHHQGLLTDSKKGEIKTKRIEVGEHRVTYGMQAHQWETWGMLERNVHTMEGEGRNLLVNMDDLG